MTLQELGKLREEMTMPEVAYVSVSRATFDDLKAQIRSYPLNIRMGIGALPLRCSEFIPDGRAIGFDHEGIPTRIWILTSE